MKLEVEKYANYKCSLALSKAGLVVKVQDATTVTPAGAGDKAFGVALKNTEDPHNLGTYLKAKQVPIAFHGIVDLQLPATNTAIAVGDKLQTAATGLVDKAAYPAGAVGSYATMVSNAEKIVGDALEAVASSTGGTVKALLKLHAF